MRLGMSVPTARPDGAPLTGEALVDSARAIEQAGLDSAWFFDAIGRGFILPDPLIGASVAAAVTSRIEIGTGVLQIPLRNPVVLERRIVTAHLICGVRILIGVGAGSTPADFEALGLDFTRRMRTLEDSLAPMRRLWRGERVGAADLTPWPAAAGGPAVLIGSWKGERWIPRAAREFDGWIASGAKTSFSALAEGIARYRAAGGKRAIVTNIAFDPTGPAEPLPDTAPFHLRCAPDEAARRLGRVRDLGFDDAVLVVQRPTEAGLAAARALLR